MRKGIFISYRRSDTEGEASRLAEDLRDRLDDVQIFRDVETIAPGEDFAEALERALGDCDVLLALVGPTWLDARNESGERRLDDATDWVRQEISRALARKVRVIPVTCRNASPPKESELPEDIALLAKRQAIEIDNNRWRYDVDQLIDRLVQSQGFRRRGVPGPVPGPIPPQPTPAPPARSSMFKRWLSGGAIAFALLVGIGFMIEENDKMPNGGGLPSDPSYSLQTTNAQPSQPPPAPAPVVLPKPAPVPAPTRQPDVSGLWRTNDGELYSFQQSGSDIVLTMQVNGVVVGTGRGALNGPILQLQVVVPMGNTQLQAQCSMQAAPNWQSFTGLCSGPRGQYPAHLFR